MILGRGWDETVQRLTRVPTLDLLWIHGGSIKNIRKEIMIGNKGIAFSDTDEFLLDIATDTFVQQCNHVVFFEAVECFLAACGSFQRSSGRVVFPGQRRCLTSRPWLK